MNFDAYARTGVELVNSRLDDLDDLRALFHGEHAWMRDEVSERDIAIFRRAKKRLRCVFEYGTSGSDADAVRELNSLLAAYPVQPRISAHDSNDWHMHVTSRGASVSSEFLAGAVWGLAVWLCEYGSARFGVCADNRCGNVYLDTSSNCCRRFCSERCATRSHVAAHRARKRAAVAEKATQQTADADQVELAEKVTTVEQIEQTVVVEAAVEQDQRPHLSGVA